MSILRAQLRMHVWIRLIISILILLASSVFSQQISNITSPIATTRNGTLLGVYLPGYDQDAFLGVPFAQPPVGQLRFKRPRSYGESWSGTREAKEYGMSCMQYASTAGFQGKGEEVSEDCLTVNGTRNFFYGLDRNKRSA